MLDSAPTLERLAGKDGSALRASGVWTAQHADALERLIRSMGTPAADKSAADKTVFEIDVSRITRLDTFGAWLIERLRRELTRDGATPRLTGLADDHRGLVEAVGKVQPATDADKAAPGALITLTAAVGHAMTEVADTMVGLANMTGAIIAAAVRIVTRPVSFRFTSLVHHLEQVGWRAVPIMVLITFLIGCIIAQQGIFHFRKFGADVYVVDMVGVLVLREIGVLIVAIMVAGRSGSAYTAELGSMKMREEIDALRTMGFDPVEVLIIPRVLALIIALPILTFIGSMAALYGGGLVSWLYGGLQPEIFLSRLREAISLDHFKVGMIKAPFMAGVIGVIACVEGLNVRGSAESLGGHTTSSVVKSIFFVIVLDGVFAIFFASIGM